MLSKKSDRIVIKCVDIRCLCLQNANEECLSKLLHFIMYANVYSGSHSLFESVTLLQNALNIFFYTIQMFLGGSVCLFSHHNQMQLWNHVRC